jgi:hypothetical protein
MKKLKGKGIRLELMFFLTVYFQMNSESNTK